MNIISYIKSTYAEMKHVTWPSRHQVIVFTVLTVVVALIVAYYLGLFDFIFTKLLNIIIG